MNAEIASKRARYIQLGVLVFASGGIYPLLYLRQNFEVSMLEAFQITSVAESSEVINQVNNRKATTASNG